MIYSSACEYAIRAVTYLAGRPDGLVKLREISKEEDIPAPFLANILHRLVAAGILRSARGPTGGYGLTRPPPELSLLDIKEAIDGLRELEQCAVGLERCSDETPCPLHDSWKPIRAGIRDYLANTTLEAMAAAKAGKMQGGSGGSGRKPPAAGKPSGRFRT
jgi:Rrf2 family transcriptional regulator, iron-sulfur cluster assembly transcription factor